MAVPVPQKRRATLFVGGLVLEGLPAALESGADIVCIDLEDAVPSARKREAREAALAALRSVVPPLGVQLIVRVNMARSEDGIEDVRSLLAANVPVGALLLPKVDGPDDVLRVADWLDDARSDLELGAIVETAEGLEHCIAIARAHPRLTVLFFGGFDLSTSLGCAMDWEPLLYARSRVVHAAALAGIESLDSPYPDVGDLDGLAADCARIKAIGMSGKCAKHASQITTIRKAFTPSADEVERARRVLDLFRADPTRPLVVDGRLIELPGIKRLERVAAQAPES